MSDASINDEGQPQNIDHWRQHVDLITQMIQSVQEMPPLDYNYIREQTFNKFTLLVRYSQVLALYFLIQIVIDIHLLSVYRQKLVPLMKLIIDITLNFYLLFRARQIDSQKPDLVEQYMLWEDIARDHTGINLSKLFRFLSRKQQNLIYYMMITSFIYIQTSTYLIYESFLEQFQMGQCYWVIAATLPVFFVFTSLTVVSTTFVFMLAMTIIITFIQFLLVLFIGIPVMIANSVKLWLQKRRQTNALNSLPRFQLNDIAADNRLCSICLHEYTEQDVIVQVPCNSSTQHVFHDDCVRAWLAMHNTCPICRTQVW